MGAQKGKDLLVKMYDGASYVTVAGLRSRRIAFNAELVDITHAESVDRWRELLAGAGAKAAIRSVSGCNSSTSRSTSRVIFSRAWAGVSSGRSPTSQYSTSGP